MLARGAGGTARRERGVAGRKVERLAELADEFSPAPLQRVGPSRAITRKEVRLITCMAVAAEANNRCHSMPAAEASLGSRPIRAQDSVRS